MPLSVLSTSEIERACPALPQRSHLLDCVIRTSNHDIVKVPSAYDNHNNTIPKQLSHQNPDALSPYVVMSAFLTTMKRSVKSLGSNEQLARSYPSHSLIQGM